MKSRSPLLLLIFMLSTFLCLDFAVGQSLTLRDGDPFQVNTYTTGSQRSPAVAAAPTGSFVVLWHSQDAELDSSSDSVQAQLYDGTGAPVGGQFQVNSYTTGTQRYGAATMDDEGNFVVVFESWGSAGTDTIYSSIQVRRFDSSGNPVGAETQVNTYTTGTQRVPDLASDGAGRFVVVWRSDGSDNGDSDGASIQGRRLDSSGNPIGDQFLVNTYTTGDQGDVDVAMDSQGGFFVVWEGNFGKGGDAYPIFGQRFASDGSRLGSELMINVDAASYNNSPAVAVDPQDDFMVVWSGTRTDNGDSEPFGIQARRYGSDGAPAGDPFVVNELTAGSQSWPDVAIDDRGDLVFVWEGGTENGDGSSRSIQAQRYASNGTRLDSQILVNTYTTERQTIPVVATLPTGDFVVSWQSYRSAGADSFYSIHGQMFRAMVFSDGFESGDLSNWSTE